MPLDGIGGAQIFLYNISQNMSERGHDVHIHNWISYKRLLWNTRFYFNLPVKIHPFLPGMGRAFNRFPPLAKRYVRTLQAIHRYDVWIIIGAYPDAYIASSLAGAVPLILRTYGRDIQIDNEIGYGVRRDPRVNDRTIYAVNKMDRTVAISETVHVEYTQMGVPESNIVDIPNGVDVPRFQSKLNGYSIRNAYSIPDDKVFILTVGRNDPKKGFDTIPAIARVLKQRGISFDWRIVGRDTHELEPALRKAGVSDFVHTVGEIGPSVPSNASDKFPLVPGDELVALFQAADVFVFPSRLETYGQVLIQAMAANLPVVTTDAPGCRDVTKHNVNGLIASPDNIEQFADHISSIIDSQTLRNQLIEGGLRKAHESDWPRIASSYEDVCYSLVSQNFKSS